jgi:hypothetical protein
MLRLPLQLIGPSPFNQGRKPRAVLCGTHQLVSAKVLLVFEDHNLLRAVGRAEDELDRMLQGKTRARL